MHKSAGCLGKLLFDEIFNENRNNQPTAISDSDTSTSVISRINVEQNKDTEQKDDNGQLFQF